MKITIRKGNPEDIEALQQLFVDTIQAVCIQDYTEEQVRVWAGSIENKHRWNTILNSQFVLVAMDGTTITGFCTLENGHYVDLLYIHKEYQHQGIATALYRAIEQEALKQEQMAIQADVSETAKPFFEKMGFETLSKQTVVIKGISLFNYKMIKVVN